MYRVVLTRVIAIGNSWGMLKLNLVEAITCCFSGLFILISLLTHVVAWRIVVLKLADNSDIAQTIISHSSESDGKQMKVPFCRNHGCFEVPGLTENGLVCTAKTCLDLATHWYTQKRDNSVMFLPLLFLEYSLARLRQTVMLPCQFSLSWKLCCAYQGGFSN